MGNNKILFHFSFTWTEKKNLAGEGGGAVYQLKEIFSLRIFFSKRNFLFLFLFLFSRLKKNGLLFFSWGENGGEGGGDRFN